MNMLKFRRGLSIFEDQKLRKHLTTNTAAPILNSDQLSSNLVKFLFSDANLGKGP